MAILLTDSDIQRLLGEPKPLPNDYRKRIALKRKRGHKESELEFTGDNGSEFRLILRQADSNPLDFSVILAYMVPQSNQVFRLRRYNGKAPEHTNRLEGNTFYDFHIHQATERYQDSGFREDTFAKPTEHYSDLSSAVRCFIRDCGFRVPPESDDPQVSFPFGGAV